MPLDSVHFCGHSFIDVENNLRALKILRKFDYGKNFKNKMQDMRSLE